MLAKSPSFSEKRGSSGKQRVGVVLQVFTENSSWQGTSVGSS